MLETIFALSVLMIVFAYFGYPLTLRAILMFRAAKVDKRPVTPPVTMIITAFNEEKRIGEKLDNTLSLVYPREKLQIIVASDGSTDRTHDIVLAYADQGVELLMVEDRGGKENAQKKAVEIARGEILVFTDVATRIDPDGLAQIINNFADPAIGCVSSEDRFIGSDGKPAGEGAYVRYEMWLRRLESRVHSLVGLSGSFFAARKAVCDDFSSEMQSDFRTLLNSQRLGMRGICDPQAIGYYPDISEPKKEMDRKIRTVVRGLTVFFRNIEMLNPFRYGLFSFQLICHKLLRWLVPFFMVVALATNLVLAPGSRFYLFLLVCQLLFYGLAVIVHTRVLTTRNVILKIPSYFLIVNLAIVLAWWRFLKGDRIVMWTPSDR
jgi:glycosyltransferase involved in cell wall biosynthesis